MHSDFPINTAKLTVAMRTGCCTGSTAARMVRMPGEMVRDETAGST
ncbi:MAG: hypothetical protein GDA53_06210 [Rhodobacteraceae bacterium]|nr:hypothetical protein [Paracoccaceae bacterium]